MAGMEGIALSIRILEAMEYKEKIKVPRDPTAILVATLSQEKTQRPRKRKSGRVCLSESSSMTVILRELFGVAIMRRVADVNIRGINIDGLESHKKYRCASVADVQVSSSSMRLSKTSETYERVAESCHVWAEFWLSMSIEKHYCSFIEAPC